MAFVLMSAGMKKRSIQRQRSVGSRQLLIAAGKGSLVDMQSLVRDADPEIADVSMSAGMEKRSIQRQRSVCSRQLLIAAGKGSLEDVHSLVTDADADVNFVDADGNTPLHWAAEGGHVDVVNFLLQQKSITISSENKRVETALDLAKGSREVLTAICVKIREIAEHISEKHMQHQTELETRRKHEEDELSSFIESTAAGNYQYELSLEEVKSLLELFCPTETLSPSTEILFALTFKISRKKSVSVLHAREQTFFTFAVPTQEPKLFYKEVEAEGDDPVILALMRIIRVCEWLQTNSPVKLESNVEDLLNVVCDEETFKRERIFYSNFLLEKKKTYDKISFFLDSLDKLSDSDTHEFCYKNVNIIIQFLETFSMEDTYPKLPMETKEVKRLAKLKKQYYLRHFPYPAEKNHRVIRNTRNFILHNSRNLITSPSFFKTIKDDGKTVHSLFADLKLFAKIVKNNVQNSMQAHKTDYGNLPLVPPKLDDNSDEETLKDKLFGFVKKLYEYVNVKKVRNGEENEVKHELVFDLVVNIYPKLQKEDSRSKPKKLTALRNSLIHDFQNVNWEMIKDNLILSMPELYRYIIARDVHILLTNLEVDAEVGLVHKRFTDALKDVNKIFQNFERTLTEHQASGFFPEVNRDCSMADKEDWLGDINIYLKYMAPLFYWNHLKYFEDERDCEEKRPGMEINGMAKREIFEMFVDFEKLNREDASAAFNNMQSEIRRQLTEKFNFDWEDVNYVVEVISLNEVKCYEAEKDVKDIVKGLKSVFNLKELRTYKISPKDISSLFEESLHGGNLFSSDVCKAVVNKYGLGDREKVLIERALSALHIHDKMTQIAFREVTIQVSLSNVVVNLLHMFEQEYKLYQVQSECIEDIFNDEIFIDNLVSFDVETLKDGTATLGDRHEAFRRIRLLRNEQYTAQYVAHLITKSSRLDIIEMDCLTELVRRLLQKGQSSYFQNLLSLENRRVSEALARIITENNVENQSLRIILEGLSHTDKLTECLDFMLNEALSPESQHFHRICHSIFSISNELALEFVEKGKLDTADKVVYAMVYFERILSGQGVQIKTSLAIERHLIKAKLKNAQGRDYPESSVLAAAPKYKEALLALEKVTEKEEAYYYMLALSRRAHTLELLARLHFRVNYRTLKPLRPHSSPIYEAAITEAEGAHYLQLQLWRYCLKHVDVSVDATDQEQFEGIYTKAKRSRRYQALLDSSPENKKYLNLFAIKFTLIRYASIFTVRSNHLQAAEKLVRWQNILGTLHEIYGIMKREAGDECTQVRANLVIGSKALCYRHMANACGPSSPDFIFYTFKSLELHILRYYDKTSRSGPYSKTAKRSLKDIGQSLEFIKVNISLPVLG